MKTLLILPYFGTLPNYFDLYLHTVKANPSVDWLLITDDKTPREFPANMKVVGMSYDEITALFQSKFDFEINLMRKHKLCDFKPSYGFMFEEFVQGYDFWGHCDPDILWGNFTHFIDYKKLANFDKIFVLGHLTLYKNTPQNNARFQASLNGKSRYREVYSNLLGYAYDEKFGGSMNNIFMEHGWPLFTENFSADIDPYHTNFRLSILDVDKQKFSLEAVTKQLFTWENGNIFRYYLNGSQLVKEEFLYIHMQKRKMEVNIQKPFPQRLRINPKSFDVFEGEITAENFNEYYKPYWFNNQFFKVKFNSLKFRLKYKVW